MLLLKEYSKGHKHENKHLYGLCSIINMISKVMKYLIAAVPYQCFKHISAGNKLFGVQKEMHILDLLIRALIMALRNL